MRQKKKKKNLTSWERELRIGKNNQWIKNGKKNISARGKDNQTECDEDHSWLEHDVKGAKKKG